MKSFILLIVAITSLSVSGQSTASVRKNEVSAMNSPVMIFEDANHDFGDVLEGKKITHTFVYKNAGHDTLRITKIDCGKVCSVTEKYDSVLAPGETGYMVVEFDTDNKLGYTTKKVVITYASASRQTEITLNVQANVIVKM